MYIWKVKTLLRYSFIWCIVVLFCACGENRVPKKAPETLYCQPSLFLPERLLNPLQELLSFPLWFDDSLIKKNQITRIVISEMGVVEDEESQEELRRQRIYSFDESAKIKELELIEYYDGMEIDRKHYFYATKSDADGFVQIRCEKVSADSGDNNVYKKDRSTSSYLSFQNTSTEAHLYFLPKKENWGVLSVDTILSATSDDIIAYGTPERPEKIFQIKNKVEEIHSLTFQRDPKTGCLISTQNNEEPFATKRSFEYGKWGVTRFIDSTFSGSGFLSRQVYYFRFQAEGLPTELHRRTNGEGANERLWKIEYFYGDIKP